jgi:hypothetical protein
LAIAITRYTATGYITIDTPFLVWYNPVLHRGYWIPGHPGNPVEIRKETTMPGQKLAGRQTRTEAIEQGAKYERAVKKAHPKLSQDALRKIEIAFYCGYLKGTCHRGRRAE